MKNILFIILFSMLITSCNDDEHAVKQVNGCIIRLSGAVEVVSKIEFSGISDTGKDLFFIHNEEKHLSPYTLIPDDTNNKYEAEVHTNIISDDIRTIFYLENKQQQSKKITIEVLWMLDGNIIKKKTSTKEILPDNGLTLVYHI
ncbi:hypothetical protein HPS54_03785 [Prevotella sp. PCHR]|uniref:Lipoprotein n=1 Tax=Xylanibacter caecicola TaxID=2736294 RepID=A0ABX2AZG6_9BACT|nr:hypothetical protein [Xylanibacter caecicola]NPE24644.1 hypothetical protein [Xylanibacter caecicola]